MVATSAAVCIVGEWRTFSMPAVHNGIEQARRIWNADVFMFYHLRYDARAMAHPNRQNASACAEDLRLTKDYAHVEHLPYNACKSVAINLASLRCNVSGTPDFSSHSNQRL